MPETPAQIENCLAFRCPQQWSALEPTAAPQIRHCPACQRSVYLCTSDREFLTHAREGRCVAVPLLGLAQLALGAPLAPDDLPQA